VERNFNLWKETTEYVNVPDDEANKDLPVGEEPKTKTVPKIKEGYDLVNSNKPIWLRPPKGVEEKEYEEFYKLAFRSSYDTYSHETFAFFPRGTGRVQGTLVHSWNAAL
jgi:HSP90 family molecular chaperone